MNWIHEKYLNGLGMLHERVHGHWPVFVWFVAVKQTVCYVAVKRTVCYVAVKWTVCYVAVKRTVCYVAVKRTVFYVAVRRTVKLKNNVIFDIYKIVCFGLYCWYILLRGVYRILVRGGQ